MKARTISAGAAVRQRGDRRAGPQRQRRSRLLHVQILEQGPLVGEPVVEGADGGPGLPDHVTDGDVIELPGGQERPGCGRHSIEAGAAASLAWAMVRHGGIIERELWFYLSEL